MSLCTPQILFRSSAASWILGLLPSVVPLFVSRNKPILGRTSTLSQEISHHGEEKNRSGRQVGTSSKESQDRPPGKTDSQDGHQGWRAETNQRQHHTRKENNQRRHPGKQGERRRRWQHGRRKSGASDVSCRYGFTA